MISLRPGMEKDRDDDPRHKLIDIQYDRNDMDFSAERSGCGEMCWRFPRHVAILYQSGIFSETRLTRITEIDA